jgi:hypothetical protein
MGIMQSISSHITSHHYATTTCTDPSTTIQQVDQDIPWPSMLCCE